MSTRSGGLSGLPPFPAPSSHALGRVAEQLPTLTVRTPTARISPVVEADPREARTIIVHQYARAGACDMRSLSRAPTESTIGQKPQKRLCGARTRKGPPCVAQREQMAVAGCMAGCPLAQGRQ